MKLIIAILRDIDHDAVSQSLTAAGFRVTMIASTGGFWRRGNTTLMVGCEDEQVEPALNVIRQSVSPASEPGTRHATIFVIKVDQYVHF
ncbi:MAG: cyclic-di-AMP receptor [Anaerolineaceae bacterium]|nr:cyclic-di-AMP receptor [Anaerolineaceae bacterium]